MKKFAIGLLIYLLLGLGSAMLFGYDHDAYSLIMTALFSGLLASVLSDD